MDVYSHMDARAPYIKHKAYGHPRLDSNKVNKLARLLG